MWPRGRTLPMSALGSQASIVVTACCGGDRAISEGTWGGSFFTNMDGHGELFTEATGEQNLKTLDGYQHVDIKPRDYWFGRLLKGRGDHVTGT